MGSKAIKLKENKVWTKNCSPKICFKDNNITLKLNKGEQNR